MPYKTAGHVLAIFLILLAGIFSYANSTDGTFHFDDAHSIQENLSIRTLDGKAIWSGNNHNRFIGYYSFAVNYYFDGLKEVKRWHFVNIGLHLFNAILFYGVLFIFMKLLEKRGSRIAFMAALLFTVHPLFTEPVNYIQARHVLFYSCFTLSGALFALLFMKAQTGKSRILFLAAMVLCAVLASLSKEVGLFYVPAAIGLCFIALSDRNKKTVTLSPAKLLVLLAGAAILLIVLTDWIRPFDKLFLPNFHPELGRRTFMTNMLTQVKVYFKYLFLVIPLSSQLNVDHHVKIVSCNYQAFFPFLFLMTTITLLFLRRKKNPDVFFLFLWSIMAVLPYMLVAGGSQELMVEYKAYLLAMGFMGLIAVFFDYLYWCVLQKKILQKAHLIVSFFFVLLIVFSIKETRARNNVWKDNLSLWNDAVKNSPQKFRPNFNLANALADSAQYEQAILYYKKALKIMPQHIGTHLNIGNIYSVMKNSKMALQHFQTAALIDKESGAAYYNLANELSSLKRTDAAIENYHKALALMPAFAGGYINLGMVLEEKGHIKEAVASYEKAVQIDRKAANAYLNLANIFRRQKKIDEAEKYYRLVIEIKPEEVKAYCGLGIILHGLGQKAESEKYFKKAISIDPEFAESFFYLAEVLRDRGKVREAVHNYLQSLKLRPDWVRPAIRMAQIFATSEDKTIFHPDKAFDLAIYACELTHYGHPFALEALALAYFAKGQGKKAETSGEEALRLARESGYFRLEVEIRKRLEDFQIIEAGR